MSLEQLLEELLTSQWSEENPTAPLNEYAKADVLAGVTSRYERTDDVTVKGNAYDICAYVLREEAGPWIRAIANEPILNLHALSFFRALANCLGDEGFDIAVKKLDAEFPHQVAMTAHALLAFDSKHRLFDWVEAYVKDRNPPITKAWGQLVALAGMDWQRIDDWLAKGPLLGLIALDAMHCCHDHDVGEGGWLYTYEPVLGDPADFDTMSNRLKSFADAHPTPRITRTVDTLLALMR